MEVYNDLRGGFPIPTLALAPTRARALARARARNGMTF